MCFSIFFLKKFIKNLGKLNIYTRFEETINTIMNFNEGNNFWDINKNFKKFCYIFTHYCEKNVSDSKKPKMLFFEITQNRKHF